jgi:hypothetical protein
MNERPVSLTKKDMFAKRRFNHLGGVLSEMRRGDEPEKDLFVGGKSVGPLPALDSEFPSLLESLACDVSVEALLFDKVAQEKLSKTLGIYSERSKRANKLPVVELREARDLRLRKKEEQGGAIEAEVRLGARTEIEHARFTLADDQEHIYYFRNENAREHPGLLGRVPISGGVAESYDYAADAWVNNEQGWFAPPKKIGERFPPVILEIHS